MTESRVEHFNGGVCLVGPDAIRMAKALTLWSAIRLLQKGIQPTRGFTMKKALAMATTFTGKTYKRSESEQARVDVKKWADEMRAALPHTVEG